MISFILGFIQIKVDTSCSCSLFEWMTLVEHVSVIIMFIIAAQMLIKLIDVD